MMRRLQTGEDGSAMITALLATILMLALGIALLAIVDTQADQSAQERTRDRGFNVAESVLNSEAFVLGRNWPETGVAGCGTAAGFGDPIGVVAGSTPDSERLRRNLTDSYNPASDAAYTGATWRVDICDDNPGSTVWDPALLGNANYDSNANNRVWVRAQTTVGTKTRQLVGLVAVRTNPAVDSRYALVSGGMSDDLGSSIDSITNNGVLRDLLSRLIATTRTVARDPNVDYAVDRNGVTGLRCGAADIIGGGSPCISGTLAAAAAVPVVASLVTGDRIENFPNTTSTDARTIERLRAQARKSLTYTPVSAGTAPVPSTNPLNLTDTAPAIVTPCTITGTPDVNQVAFIEQVGNSGTSGVGGEGDQYCSISVATAKTYKAIVVASGRIVIRGNNTTTASTNRNVNTFNGVVYSLNLQRLPVNQGGRGLGDIAVREVVRIDRGAHVHGAVHADGRSARIGIYPPPITINSNALVDALIPCVIVLGVPVCILRDTIKALTGGLTAIVDNLVSQVGLTAVVNALFDQVNPQRTSYGSAITADVTAIKAFTVRSSSGVIPGTFRDLAAR